MSWTRSTKSREKTLANEAPRTGIPKKWVIETFPFDRQPKLNRKKTLALYDAFDYMTECRNIIFIGRPAWGKPAWLRPSYSCDHNGYNGRFITFPIWWNVSTNLLPITPNPR